MLCYDNINKLEGKYSLESTDPRESEIHALCGVAFPMECMCVATYLLNAESINACRCGVANKSRIIEGG